MPTEPSPINRLLRLEHAVEQLVAANLPEAVRHASKPAPPARAIWPADQLLLTRILRRTPQVLNAYQAPAQLAPISDKGVRLSTSETDSVFQFCELIGGDAVVWVDADAPDWAWESESFRAIFDCPPQSEFSRKLVLQELPLFKPISRGESWVLQRRGEMMPQARTFPEQAEQARLLSRLEALERQVSQQTIQLESAIKDLRTQVQAQQYQIEQLLRLSPEPQ